MDVGLVFLLTFCSMSSVSHFYGRKKLSAIGAMKNIHVILIGSLVTTLVNCLMFSQCLVYHFYGCEKLSENMGIEIGGKMCILNWFSSNGIGQLFNILFVCLGLQSGGYVVLVESTTESSKEVQ